MKLLTGTILTFIPVTRLNGTEGNTACERIFKERILYWNVYI
jgi:hypothetical protein